jgi:hypothetical protein
VTLAQGSIVTPSFEGHGGGSAKAIYDTLALLSS